MIGTLIGIEEQGDVRPNHGDGIQVVNSSGTADRRAGAHEGNVIAANAGNGITIDGSSGNVSSGNVIRANFIGTDATGTRDRGNGGNGILLRGPPPATPSAA